MLRACENKEKHKEKGNYPMKKIAIVRFLIIAVLCLSLFAVSCGKDRNNETTAQKQNEVTESNGEITTSKDNGSADVENTTEESDVTTEKSSVETSEDGYEIITDGPGISFPEVPV